MIKWRNLGSNFKSETDWQVLNPTVFPDKTTQVWKLKLSGYSFEVEWNYESDAEIMQVGQLCDLLAYSGSIRSLNIPFMPYARQDKEIGNEATFGLHTFIKILETFPVQNIISFDVHNPMPIKEVLKYRFYNQIPYKMVEIAQEIKPDAIFFPDEGAAKRYGKIFNEMSTFHFNKVPHIFGVKLRDQSTGLITGYGIPTAVVPMPKSVLMCDDLCDGGATFITAAKTLQEQGINDISLYVSHGLFTKGTKVLFDSGIKKIYTKDGEVTERT